MAKGELLFRGGAYACNLIIWPLRGSLTMLTEEEQNLYDLSKNWFDSYRNFRLDVPEGDEELLRLGSGNYQRYFPGYPVIFTQSSLETRVWSVRHDLKTLLAKNNAAMGLAQATTATSSSATILTSQQQQDVQTQSDAYDQVKAVRRGQNSSLVAPQAGSNRAPKRPSLSQTQGSKNTSRRRSGRKTLNSNDVRAFYAARGLVYPGRGQRASQTTSTALGTGTVHENNQTASGVTGRDSIEDRYTLQTRGSRRQMASQIPPSHPSRRATAGQTNLPTTLENPVVAGGSIPQSVCGTLPASSQQHIQVPPQAHPTIHRRPANNFLEKWEANQRVASDRIRQALVSEFSLNSHHRPAQQQPTPLPRQPSNDSTSIQDAAKTLSQDLSHQRRLELRLPSVNAQGRHPLPNSPIPGLSAQSMMRSNREVPAPFTFPAPRGTRSTDIAEENPDLDTQTSTNMVIDPAPQTFTQSWLNRQPPTSDVRSKGPAMTQAERGRQQVLNDKERDQMARYYSDFEKYEKPDLSKHMERYRKE